MNWKQEIVRIFDFDNEICGENVKYFRCSFLAIY